MKRRSLDVEGYVQFPTHLPSTSEGGMYVKLWVMDLQPFESAYGVCTGVSVIDHNGECFMGSDKAPFPDFHSMYDDANSPDDYLRARDEEQKVRKEYFDRFFTDEYHEQSVPLLAAIVMGSTGWSSGDFVCTYKDLLPEGKVIYDAMQKLYPKAELHLMTFLDT